MNSPGGSSLNHQNHPSSQQHQIQLQQQQQQQQFAEQQQSSQAAAAAAAAAASLQHAQQQMNMNMMAQMGQMAQGLGQDMLQNMLNGTAADSLLALKHDPSYQLLFANNGNRTLPAANKTTINDYL